jgi:hypothetical protein
MSSRHDGLWDFGFDAFLVVIAVVALATVLWSVMQLT